MFQPVPEGLPFRQPLAFLSASLLMLGGLGLLVERSVRASAVLLMTLFALYAACYVVQLVGPPFTSSALLGLAEQSAVVIGAWAILLKRNAGQAPIIVARSIFGVCSILFGLAHLIGRVPTASMVPEWMPGGQMFWAIATGVGHLAVGVALIADRLAVTASRVGVLMYFCFVLFAWLPGAFANPTEWLRWAGAAISLCMAAALWLVGELLAAQHQDSGTAVPDESRGDATPLGAG